MEKGQKQTGGRGFIPSSLGHMDVTWRSPHQKKTPGVYKLKIIVISRSTDDGTLGTLAQQSRIDGSVTACMQHISKLLHQQHNNTLVLGPLCTRLLQVNLLGIVVVVLAVLLLVAVNVPALAQEVLDGVGENVVANQDPNLHNAVPSAVVPGQGHP